MINTIEQGGSGTDPTQETKKTKKRFTNRQQIINAIDAIDSDNEKDRVDAEVLDAIADLIRDKFQDKKFLQWTLQISAYRDKAQRCRNRAERRTKKKLPQLKRALAQFDTPVLSIELTSGDTSVPAP